MKAPGFGQLFSIGDGEVTVGLKPAGRSGRRRRQVSLCFLRWLVLRVAVRLALVLHAIAPEWRGGKVAGRRWEIRQFWDVCREKVGQQATEVSDCLGEAARCDPCVANVFAVG